MDVFKVVKRNRLFFPAACLAALAMVFVSEGSYQQSVARLNRAGVIADATATIRDLRKALLDAETGQRGYFLTLRKDYLLPYSESLATIVNSLQRLERYYLEFPALSGEFTAFRRLVEARMSELAETIRLLDEGKNDSAREILLSDIGKEEMAAILVVINRLIEREQLQFVESQAETYQTLLISRIGLAALSAVSLLALLMYLQQSLEHEKRQKDLTDLLQRERDRLEVEVVKRTAQLTELTHHLLTAREDERSRLARNLHDDLGALLTSAKLDAARIKSRIAKTAPESLDLLAHLVATLNSSITLGRGIIENLRPSALGNLGLVETLDILAREFSEASGIQIHCALAPVQLSASGELTVYRLVQESFTNIGKYAKASEVWVSLAADGPQVEVAVRDDGVGFDSAARVGSAYGLVGMRFRVQAEGGVLTVASRPGHGTTIQARLPQSVAEASAQAAPA